MPPVFCSPGQSISGTELPLGFIFMSPVNKCNKNLHFLEIIHPVEKEIVSQGRFVTPWSGLHRPQSRVVVTRASCPGEYTSPSSHSMKRRGFNGMGFSHVFSDEVARSRQRHMLFFF